MTLLKSVTPVRFAIDYGADVEEEIAHLSLDIDRYEVVHNSFPTRWLAIKLLEQALPQITPDIDLSFVDLE